MIKPLYREEDFVQENPRATKRLEQFDYSFSGSERVLEAIPGEYLKNEGVRLACCRTYFSLEVVPYE